jgi:DNA replication factor GINS
VNLDELRTVQMKERKKDSLQHLRDSFYGDVATYIEDLKAQRSRAAEQADDPFSSPEVSRLTDEIETAEEVAEAVYERRVGKVVKLASFAAADMPVDEEGMTAEERRLFDDLVGRIEQNKTAVLDTLAGKHVETDGDESAAPTTQAASEPTPGEPPTADGESSEAGGGMLADAMGGGDDQSSEPVEASAAGDAASEASDGRPVPPEEPPADGAASDGGTVTADLGHDDAGPVVSESDHDGAEAVIAESGHGTSSAVTAEADHEDAETATAGAGGAATTDDTDRTTVRITRDVGAIFGVDEREYDLSTEDVVTLPAANADPLLERDAAERID